MRANLDDLSPENVNRIVEITDYNIEEHHDNIITVIITDRPMHGLW